MFSDEQKATQSHPGAIQSVCACVCTHVHMCVGGSELSTLEGTSLLVWVTCQWVNVSASHFRWYISEVFLHVPLSLSSGMEPSCLSISAHGHTHCLFSLPCLTSPTPCTQVLFPWFSLKGTSQNFGLPSHRENSGKNN